eukprot:GHVT01069195.1.p1 GENE.GHVT01069195.1~~GHVT01069195.1.p1  ORF type:complete len:270 (-),score=53.94 GHVT01069195.1:33-842(-)
MSRRPPQAGRLNKRPSSSPQASPARLLPRREGWAAGRRAASPLEQHHRCNHPPDDSETNAPAIAAADTGAGRICLEAAHARQVMKEFHLVCIPRACQSPVAYGMEGTTTLGVALLGDFIAPPTVTPLPARPLLRFPLPPSHLCPFTSALPAATGGGRLPAVCPCPWLHRWGRRPPRSGCFPPDSVPPRRARPLAADRRLPAFQPGAPTGDSALEVRVECIRHTGTMPTVQGNDIIPPAANFNNCNERQLGPLVKAGAWGGDVWARAGPG